MTTPKFYRLLKKLGNYKVSEDVVYICKMFGVGVTVGSIAAIASKN